MTRRDLIAFAVMAAIAGVIGVVQRLGDWSPAAVLGASVATMLVVGLIAWPQDWRGPRRDPRR